MTKPTVPDIHRLRPGELSLFNGMLDVFARAFEEPETYSNARPAPGYVNELLGREDFVALVAKAGDGVVGAVTAYELQKYEQARREIYIYDLAVAETHRRRGYATALIEGVKAIARDRDAYVVIIQAERGDEPAATLYTKLGIREEVLHFDIDPGGP